MATPRVSSSADTHPDQPHMWHGQVCIFPGCPASKAEYEVERRRKLWEAADRLNFEGRALVECPFCVALVRDLPEKIKKHDDDHRRREFAERGFLIG